MPGSVSRSDKQLDTWTLSHSNFTSQVKAFEDTFHARLDSLARKPGHTSPPQRRAGTCTTLSHYHLVGTKHFSPQRKLPVHLLRLKDFRLQPLLTTNGRGGGFLVAPQLVPQADAGSSQKAVRLAPAFLNCTRLWVSALSIPQVEPSMPGNVSSSSVWLGMPCSKAPSTQSLKGSLPVPSSAPILLRFSILI